MGKYAANTDVSAINSLVEIEKTLRRYEATGFNYGWDDNHRKVAIAFRMHSRHIRFIVPLPDPNDREFEKVDRYSHRRTGEFSPEKYDQAVRQRYRALALVIKAKLESVESGIETFDDAFMAQITLPDGSTIGDVMKPQIEQMYLDGKMPPLLPMLSDGR